MRHRSMTLLGTMVILTLAFGVVAGGAGSGKEEILTHDLEIQFADAFDKVSCPSGGLDAARWRPLEGEISCESGNAVVKATNLNFVGPGVGPVPMAMAGMASKQRHFNGGLSGTNLMEVDFVGYASDGDYVNTVLDTYGRVSGFESPADGKYEMGWSLQIGNFSGRIGEQPVKATERGLQVQFDLWTRRGLVVLLGRNSVPGDEKLYSKWDSETVPFDEIKKGPFIDQSFVVLAVRSFGSGELNPAGHRYGLGCTDSGNKLFWTLDGRVMDTVDIKGFFGASPDSIKGGAYVSIVGDSSYKNTVWKYDNVRISVSPR